MSYVIEDCAEGRALVVTGPWSSAAAAVLQRGEADSLVLNYARGFIEANLEFIEAWPIRRLRVLDRQMDNLEPIERLSGSLESLAIEAAPRAEFDFQALPGLRSVSGEWQLLRPTLGHLGALEKVITWQFDEADLHAFRDHVSLKELKVKDAPGLESLSGLADLSDLTVLSIVGARQLSDISDVSRATSLLELEFEECPSIDALDDLETLASLRLLAVGDCAQIASLVPIASLRELETFHGWGSTNIVDEDLSPLASLPRLKEIRMRDRRGYRPRVKEFDAAMF